ncbi:MAG: hypothetical protein Q8P49_01490 [Candidatus Liptonbacteria bacterium]|nr:hypothetical protein [Candidatus Liptonbacteria bacterium]
MDQRTAQILEAAIEEFIDIGEPVSSSRLYERHRFGIKPAMIRLELERLSDEGFLEQPHHSAGRVPTDKGYEFFAERVLTDDRGMSGGKILRQMLMRHELPDLAGELASELGLLSIAAEPEKKSFYKEGLEALVEQMDPADIKSVIGDFVEIENRLESVSKKLRKADIVPKVFVGKKSPITKSESLSVVMGSYESGEDRVLLFAIGPKRMDYRKTVGVFKNL